MRKTSTLIRVTYFLGRIVAGVAVLLRLIRVTEAGGALAYRLAIQPRSLMGAAGVLFLSSIATVAYRYETENEIATVPRRPRAI